MVRIYGNASRAGIGGTGLDIPLDPPVVSAQLAAARLERQAQRQAAAEDAAALVTTKPRRRRSRSAAATETFCVASMSPVPARVVAAPAPPTPPVPPVVEEIEDLVPAGPVPCQDPDCSQVVIPEFVARTGQRIHPPCRARQQATASTASTSRRTGELVGAGRRAS